MSNNRFAKYRHFISNYKFQSLFFSYLKSILLVILAVFLMFATVIYSHFTLNANESLSQYYKQLLSKTADLFDTITSKMEQNISLITNDNSMLHFLLSSSDEVERLDRNYRMKLISLLFHSSLDSPGVDSIYVYGTKSGYIASWTEIRSAVGYLDGAWLQLLPSERSITYARVKYAPSTGSNASKDIVTTIVPIQVNEKSLGYIIYNVDLRYFSSIVDNQAEGAKEIYYIADREGNIFYSSSPEAINGCIEPNTPLSTAFDAALDNEEYISLRNPTVVMSRLSKNGEYVLLSETSDRVRLESQRSYLQIIILGGLLSLIISLVLALFISLRLYSHVIQIISVFNSSDAAVAGFGEMSYITSNILQMIHRNNTIETELANKLTELKKAQSAALSNQINPHFLLNTLQLINVEIIKREKQDTIATQTIALLSDILRTNLRTSEYLVPLIDEIELAEKYIKIENIRNEGKFKVEWGIDTKVLNCKTVKFILQPVLENSIIHGLSTPNVDRREIYINIHGSDGSLYITVRDTGLGVPEDILEAIKKKLSESYLPENDHIGLCNIDRRIKLVFGSEYGVSIESVNRDGTTVSIKQQLEEDKDW